ncbi:hypothetical protein PAL_GLEAN10013060 [Pteropus alecto]|uniref:Uncharacterized protein n=1 Tax=Pteropus alecto TaxID=9402 RepID=L5KGW5_PTEAL|nr:hypothetical protein PAL_GLEAN10013060 [Pteropus alecto]
MDVGHRLPFTHTATSHHLTKVLSHIHGINCQDPYDVNCRLRNQSRVIIHHAGVFAPWFQTRLYYEAAPSIRKTPRAGTRWLEPASQPSPRSDDYPSPTAHIWDAQAAWAPFQEAADPPPPRRSTLGADDPTGTRTDRLFPTDTHKSRCGTRAEEGTKAEGLELGLERPLLG